MELNTIEGGVKCDELMVLGCSSIYMKNTRECLLIDKLSDWSYPYLDLVQDKKEPPSSLILKLIGRI